MLLMLVALVDAQANACVAFDDICFFWLSSSWLHGLQAEISYECVAWSAVVFCNAVVVVVVEHCGHSHAYV